MDQNESMRVQKKIEDFKNELIEKTLIKDKLNLEEKILEYDQGYNF